jgi:hypothetical protein
MSDDRILDKIKKCMALSASSNEHEAAAALRQARKLMEAHGISDQDVLASQAQEHRSASDNKVKPPLWESNLAACVAMAFGCDCIFVRNWRGAASWTFVGAGPAAEVAGYAFEVLQRQCKRARGQYIDTALRRCGRVNKTKRADVFAIGWVHTVQKTVTRFARTEQQEAAVTAYIAAKYGQLMKLDAIDRMGDKLSSRQLGDWLSGAAKGADAELHRGVGPGAEVRQLT